MERSMRMALAFGVVVAVMLQCAVAQTVHVVGDSLGWTVPSNGAQAYVSWASSKNFMVGDTLLFNFATNNHDVLQVTKDSFDACTSANSIGSVITTGPANVTLTSASDHYYICTVGRHCSAGQKLSITVSAATGTPSAAPPPSATAAPPPPPPSTPSPTSGTTPEACAPAPSTNNPTTGGPTASTTPGQVPPPPPMDSSSPAVLGGFVVTILSIAMAALF